MNDQPDLFAAPPPPDPVEESPWPEPLKPGERRAIRVDAGGKVNLYFAGKPFARDVVVRWRVPPEMAERCREMYLRDGFTEIGRDEYIARRDI